MTRRPWIGALAVAAAALTAGCSPSSADLKTSPTVTADRAAATSRVEHMLDRVAVGGTVLGRGQEDWCDPGQHNWKVDSAYKLRCEVHAFVLVRPEQPLARSVNELRDALEAAGCPAATLTIEEVERRDAAHLSLRHRGDCAPLTVGISPVTDRNEVVLIGSSNPPQTSAHDLSITPLTDEALDQVDRAEPFAWFIEVSQTYADIPA